MDAVTTCRYWPGDGPLDVEMRESGGAGLNLRSLRGLAKMVRSLKGLLRSNNRFN
jgi:hypothetical protein